MSTSMKKNKIIFMVVIIILLIVSIACVYKYILSTKQNESEQVKLSEGIYSLTSYGCMYFQKNEDVEFDLLLYYYNDDMDTNDLMNYHDFYVVTNDNSRIELSVTDEVKKSFEVLDNQNIMQGNITITIGDQLVNGDGIVITGIIYTDGDGKEHSVNLGEISIYKTDITNKYISAEAIKYEWTRYELPLMYTYDVYLANVSDSKVIFNEIDFGMTQINGPEANAEIGDEEELNLEVEIQELAGNFIFYMKPIINIEVDGEKFSEVQTNISRQKYVSSEETVYDYFLGIQKKGN